MDDDTSSVRFYADHPADWQAYDRYAIIRGWCFASDGKPITSIRLRTPDLILAGVTGLPRPDVKAAVPETPNGNTGFEIRGTLPPGRTNIQRWSHGWLLLRMVLFAARKLKFVCSAQPPPARRPYFSRSRQKAAAS